MKGGISMTQEQWNALSHEEQKDMLAKACALVDRAIDMIKVTGERYPNQDVFVTNISKVQYQVRNDIKPLFDQVINRLENEESSD